jgi:hypothetical protein
MNINYFFQCFRNSNHSISNSIASYWLHLSWAIALIGFTHITTINNTLSGRYEYFSKLFDLGVCNAMSRIILFLYMFVIFIVLVKKNTREMFAGISIFMVLFWILVIIRFIFSCMMGELPNSYNAEMLSKSYGSILSHLSRLSFLFIAVGIASCGIPNIRKDKTFFWILGIVLLFSIILVVVYHSCFLTGTSIRYSNLGAIHKYYPYQIKAISVTIISNLGVTLAILSFWGYSMNKIKPLYFFLMYTMGTAMEFIHASRTFFIIFVVCQFIIFIIAKPKKRYHFYVSILLMILINIGLNRYMGNGLIFERLTSKTSNEVNNVVESVVAAPSATNKSTNNEDTDNQRVHVKQLDRGYIWGDSIRKIMEHPILGYGFSPYKTIGFSEDRPHTPSVRISPHSAILESFLIVGIIGGILFTIVVFQLLYDSVIVMRQCPEIGWIGVYAIGLCIFVVLYESCLNIPFWFLAAALRAIVLSLNKGEKTRDS